ncbi:hypothetical protein BGW37DRAFT_506680 [Umbelopsis sp. PMI_123]|nr:hypothetical protein BGW37DRAFT_506680 [Umbelopsis sp. PMI_123]
MESRETRIYVVLSFVTAFICIILEGMVLKALSDEAASVYDSMQQLDDGSLKEEYSYIDLSLGRVRDENIFFIVYQIFQTYYGIDSVVRQNLIQLLAHLGSIFFCAVFALVQLGETLKFKANVWSSDNSSKLSTNTGGFYEAIRYEIGLAVTMIAMTIVFAYLWRKLSLQFGWNIYKRIGADLAMQKRYRTYQVFILNLKLDAFFQFVFSVFWLVLMVQSGYQSGSAAAVVWFAIHIILTLLLLPTFFFARYGARTERPIIMWLYLTLQALVLVDFVIILQQSASTWVFWVLIVCVSIILSVTTIILTIRLTNNFGQGLKPHIQRLFDENYRDFLDSSRNPNLQKHDTRSSWVIDDIESTPANSPPPTRSATRNGWKWATRRPKQNTSNDVMLEKTNMSRTETPTQVEEKEEVLGNQSSAQQ